MILLGPLTVLILPLAKLLGLILFFGGGDSKVVCTSVATVEDRRGTSLGCFGVDCRSS